MASSFLPVLTEVEKSSIAERQPLPERYLGLSDEELDRRIAAAKAALGTRLVILGHHYQRDEVIRFADDHRRLLPLSQHCAPIPRPSSSSSAASISWRRARTSCRPRTSR